MTESRSTPAPTTHRPHIAALVAIVLLAASDWLFVVESLVRPGGIDLGFTQSNVIYLFVRNGMITTALLVAGAVALGRRPLLLVAAIVAGLHTLVGFGMAVVQLVLGAQLDFIVESAVLIICLLALCAAVVLGFVAAARGSNTLRWVGVVLAVVATAAWSSASMGQPFGAGGVSTGAIVLLVVSAAYAILLVLAAGLVGMASVKTRIAAAGILAVLVLWQFSRLPVALSIGFDNSYTIFLTLRTLLLVAAMVFAFLAARWLRRNGMLSA